MTYIMRDGDVDVVIYFNIGSVPVLENNLQFLQKSDLLDFFQATVVITFKQIYRLQQTTAYLLEWFLL